MKKLQKQIVFTLIAGLSVTQLTADAATRLPVALGSTGEFIKTWYMDTDRDNSSGEEIIAVGVTANIDKDEANVGGEPVSGIAIGNNAVVHANKGIAIGENVTAGVNNDTVPDSNTISIGNESKALTENSIALGKNATAGSDIDVEASNAIAIGIDAEANGQSSMAIGGSSKANGTRAIAIGDASRAATSGTALGANTNAADNAVAIGGGTESTAAQAIIEDSVAIGTNSMTATAVNVSEAIISSENGTELRYGNFAGDGSSTSDGYVLSVGNVNQERQIQYVAAGQITASSTDAINGSQLYATNAMIGNIAGSVAQTIGGDTTVNDNGEFEVGPEGIANTGTSTVSEAIEAARTKITSTGGTVQITPTEENGAFTYNLEVTLPESNGLNQQITNIDNRVNNLDGRVNNLDSRVDNLDNRVNKVGAGAAALAGLHPLDFNPDDKWNFATAYGNYKNANALAIGAFYRPNEDTMFSVASSMGNGENMINAGLSFKFGQNSGVTNSKVAMAKEIQDLKVQVMVQNKQIMEQNAKIDMLMNGLGLVNQSLNVEFPDVPKDHWAYGYVKTLADRGLLIGYPDGNFKGDRSMSRYEFAAIIYRALENGAPIDGNMAKAVKEFKPEFEEIQSLSRFRIDRVAGEDNDRHKIDRVRVNSKDDKENNDYRDVYGTKIEK